MPPFIIELTYNSITVDELAGHYLVVEDAIEVLEGSPKFFPNRGRQDRRRHALLERWLMVGPNARGELLSVVVEGPNAERKAHIVTGWRSSKRDETRYYRPGGRRNRP